jgi:hypothetical protein
MRLASAVAIMLLLAVSPLARAAQEAPSPSGPPPASNEAPPPEQDNIATLNVSVNLVNLYMSVRDKQGFITNLRKEDCAVMEDKAPQTIKNFTQEKNLPLTIGILLDTSA